MIELPERTVGVPGTTIYEIVYGSHAHGTATPTSDIDTRGVFILPNRSHLGVERVNTTWENKASDRVFWEVGHFVRLLLKGNPNLVGMLFTPQDTIVLNNAMLDPIMRMRDRFLSSAMASAYLGWVHRELHDIGKLHKGHAKRLSHVPRLIWEIESVLRNGWLTVRPDTDKIAVIVGIKTGQMDYDEAYALCGEMLLDLERIVEKAPDLPEPPVRMANDALLEIRRDYGGPL